MTKKQSQLNHVISVEQDLQDSLDTINQLLKNKYPSKPTVALKPLKALEAAFTEQVDFATTLCENRNYPALNAVIMIKKGLFFVDADLINLGLSLLSEYEEAELYDLLMEEVNSYNVSALVKSDDVKKIRKQVGRNVKQLRIEHGITANELAKALNITVPFLGLVERGSRGASNYNVIRLAEIFGISTDEIYFGAKNISTTTHNELLYKKLSVLLRQLPDERLEDLIKIVKALM